MPRIISMKAEYLILLSFLMTITVVTNAFYNKKQFYPSVVYLTKSSTSLAVLYLQAFVFAILLGKIVQKIFLGQLRAIETEHLYDRTWFSVTETCLAFTVFRDDFSSHFVALFAILLFLKCFHWLLEDRVDYMEQSPVLGPIFHARVISLSSALIILDYLFIVSACTHTIAKGASVQIVFGFEYAILLVSVVLTAIKYILHTIEIRTGEQWENKGVFMLYSDLLLGFIRVVLYMLFMIVMMKIHTFPLFSIRPMFIAMRAFRKSCTDVIESRRAIHDLNTMYPDLTAEELANVADTTCIICREDMQVQQSIKRLGCQHIFHKNCLRSWFQRQQACPICRKPVLRSRGTPTPNAPAAAPQQPAQAPNAGVQAAPVGIAPPPSFSAPPPPPTSTSSSTTPPVFNFTPLNSTTTQTSLPSVNIPQIPFGSFPMVLPPFAFPPPPLPPLNFTGMTDEAIRAMEGIELAHVQARIQCLRNVRTLLDASMIQMQQYMNIVSTQSNMDNGTDILKNLNNDVDQVITSTQDQLIDENDTDLIRRRRLEHLASKITTSPSTNLQDDKSNNDT
ncbi:unnamed protein product [Rotaria sp. Silwood2]|nr:unnamed protein product [Rotaria sp. Silwood2]CAF2637119.1 unnamed protein product [Rotaria sp. Silwood2]CAF2886427.1 unnamed protein product [Rotaria sp. Silwood2]CAF3031985.1 unnamed protein product [Rotaria sp. Silwood2]CAF4017797.1 unnamed protein product [Rotaria sp. Silwood2]